MKRSRKLKKPVAVPNLILEEVIGLTTKNANGLASSTSTPKCAYIAGCIVVLYDVNAATQSHLMVSNRMPKPLSCVALSRDARVVAAGESGPQPAVLLWDGITFKLICELKGHQYGVACMAFSPDGKCLASIGFSRDGYICLWDWRSKILITKIKASSECSAIASVTFSVDAKSIATSGKKHLRFWKLGSGPSTRSKSVSMQGKPNNLGCREEWSFVALSAPYWTKKNSANHTHASESPIYALTDTGILCIVVGSSITTSVELEVKKGFTLSTSNSMVACGCDNGVVKLYGTCSLTYAGSLSYTEAKRCNESNIVDGTLQSMPAHPDAIACQFSTFKKLVVIYNDHSLYIWDVRNVEKATRCCALVSHCGSIWDIKNLPCANMHDPSLSCVAKGCSGGLSFATCSADGTIRLWDLALETTLPKDELSLDLIGSFLISQPRGTACLVSAGIFERDSLTLCISSPGLRSMAVSSDGRHLVAGDCRGNLHIINLNTYDYMCIQDAHDAEILSLSFSLESKKENISTEVSESYKFLASAARGGMIHLYHVDRDFDLIGRIDYHSSAASSLNIACSGHKIISSGADRFLVVHHVSASENECKISRCHRIATGGTVQDTMVNNLMQVAVTVGQNKKINAFSIESGELLKSIKQDGDNGDPVKVTIDGSCSYLACSYSNRSICMYDYTTGEIVARAVGHSDVITGMVFLPDCTHLVSVGAESCIFVWKVPAHFSSHMLRRTKEISLPISQEGMVQQASLNQISSYEFNDHQKNILYEDVAIGELNEAREELLFQHGSCSETSAFRFSISRLPKWARAKVSILNPVHVDPNSGSFSVGPQTCSPLATSSWQKEITCPISQSPFGHSIQSSNSFSQASPPTLLNTDTDSSKRYPSPQETLSYALDNRWLRIHTVHLDILNTPSISDVEALDVSRCAMKAEDQAIETSHDNKRIKLSSAANCVDNHSGKTSFNFCEDMDSQVADLKECKNYSSTLSDRIDQHQIRKLNLCHADVSCEITAKLLSNKTGNGAREVDKDNDVSNINSQTEGRKSSARKSYSARLLMQTDCPLDSKSFSSMHAQDSVSTTQRENKEKRPNFLLKDPCSQLPEVLQRTNTYRQESGNTPANSLSPISAIPRTNSGEVSGSTESAEIPSIIGLIDGGEQKIGDIERLGKSELPSACKEALHNLDNAAQNALQLFSELANQKPQEGRLELQLYAEVAERLPSIAKKVHDISKLVQSANIVSSEKTQLNYSS